MSAAASGFAHDQSSGDGRLLQRSNQLPNDRDLATVDVFPDSDRIVDLASPAANRRSTGRVDTVLRSTIHGRRRTEDAATPARAGLTSLEFACLEPVPTNPGVEYDPFQ